MANGLSGDERREETSAAEDQPLISAAITARAMGGGLREDGLCSKPSWTLESPSYCMRETGILATRTHSLVLLPTRYESAF